MKGLKQWLGVLVGMALCMASVIYVNTSINGIIFSFDGKKYQLMSGMRPSGGRNTPRNGLSKSNLDTISSCYYLQSNYVEIIRQDHPTEPLTGLALGFEFDEQHGEYPYTPAHAVLQLKNFTWGGVEFSAADSLNFTGVSNNVSEDLFIEIDSYRNDTISGRFSGVLLSGSGAMKNIDNGYFFARLYRKNQTK